MRARTDCALGSWLLAALVLVTVGSTKCSGGSPDPLLVSGEQALVGSYKLDHVLLAPGKLVTLSNSHSMFAGMGDTPAQAAQKGLVNAAQETLLQSQSCAMTVLADHSFVITNLPSADLTHTFPVKGTWSMEVYKVFDTFGYRISLKCLGYKGPAIHAKFFSADKPDPPILEIYYGDGMKDPVRFRVAKTNWQAGSRGPVAP